MNTEEAILKKKWFYRFELPSGRTTETYIPPEIEDIHPTRLAMINSAVDKTYGRSYQETTVLDLACNQGYFSLHFAEKGCKRVVGIEARASLIEDAEMIKTIKGLSNISFHQEDIAKADMSRYGRFDIVLVMGLVYHLEDPIGVIRKASEMTDRMLLLETQVCPGVSGNVDWGTYRRQKPIEGVFALIDETEQIGIPLASITGLALCPSKEAVIWTLKKFGFKRVEIVPVPEGGNEQLVSGKRIMVAAYKD